MKKDNHYGDYGFGGCLPRPTLIPPPLPLAVPVDTSAVTTTSNMYVFFVPFYYLVHY